MHDAFDVMTLQFASTIDVEEIGFMDSFHPHRRMSLLLNFGSASASGKRGRVNTTLGKIPGKVVLAKSACKK